MFLENLIRRIIHAIQNFKGINEANKPVQAVRLYSEIPNFMVKEKFARLPKIIY